MSALDWYETIVSGTGFAIGCAAIYLLTRHKH